MEPKTFTEGKIMSSGQEQSAKMTVGEFVEMLMAEAPDIGEARVWLEHYIQNNDDPACRGPRVKWQDYCQIPLDNVGILQNIAFIFSSQISFAIRWQPKHADHLKAQGRRLLQMIYEKGREIVPGVVEEDITWLPDLGNIGHENARKI